jgi:ubiquinone/menaquinone biosynthesis C-methylase UbiE
MKIFAVLILTVTAWAQVADNANKSYKTKEGRDKIAATLDDPHRDGKQKPVELVSAMQIKPGITVADIGTGTGYMLPFLSRAVGPNGKVFGEDIQTDFLDRAKAKKEANVELILGTETDPKLPPNSVDIALALDVYHHFDYPDKMLASIRSALKPGAHLVVVDFYKSASPTPGHIRAERDEVAAEIERNGFHLLSKRDHTPNSQYMLTFEKTKQ